ncbi:hypothetical protein EYR38_006224 [Pleurotus pulmonarius]|nr:hypothetical protein EYR38_006224 [Pleurotus pulmonarius]
MTVKYCFCFNNATLCRAGSISIMDPQPVFFSDISDWNNVLASLARSFTCDYNIKVLICLSDYQGSGNKLWDEKYLPPVQYNQGFWVDWAGEVDAAWEQQMIPLYVVSTEDYDRLRGGPMAGTLKTLQNMWELLWDKGLRYVEEEVIKTRHTEHGPIRTFPSSLVFGTRGRINHYNYLDAHHPGSRFHFFQPLSQTELLQANRVQVREVSDEAIIQFYREYGPSAYDCHSSLRSPYRQKEYASKVDADIKAASLTDLERIFARDLSFLTSSLIPRKDPYLRLILIKPAVRTNGDGQDVVIRDKGRATFVTQTIEQRVRQFLDKGKSCHSPLDPRW